MRHATYHFGYTESSGNPVGGSPAPSLAGPALLLFVPLRYEVAFRHTEEDTFVRGKVSWLLHLVTARIFYEKPDGKGLSVKIGGFQLIPKKGKEPKP